MDGLKSQGGGILVHNIPWDDDDAVDIHPDQMTLEEFMATLVSDEEDGEE
jgi:hypothetical protein